MKLLVCVLALAVVTFAEVDYSTLRRRDIRIPMPFDIDIPQRDSRIVGGQVATPNSFPYVLGNIFYTAAGNYFCGGSLISQSHALTAAHCLDGVVQVESRAGAHNVLVSEPTQQIRFTSQFVRHVAWNPSTLLNDIAILVYPTPFEFNAYIQPIALPTRSQAGNSFSGQQSIVKGWGLESDSATQISQFLRWVQVEVMSNLLCNIWFLGQIDATHLCTSGSNGQGPCSGDSGSPLVLAGTNTTIGIVSFGIILGCEVGWPTAYARITVYLDWIQNNSDVIIQN